MDYGLINGIQTGATNVAPKRYTQVYQATHKGENYLPFMNRSFISFSFGGKNIEDFNLIATISGDRLQRKGYSEFEDLTSSYEILDGQFYWGTHYTNHTLDFDLATDGITQNQLDSFLKWFAAGKIKELILSEHPNRAVQARVQSAPELHLLPFEEKTSKQIAGQTFYTSTTLYKGEISLSFVMDDPYWYSKINVFGHLDQSTGEYLDEWTDANSNQKRSIFEDPDAIKVALEDNIPIGSMIQASMLLGDNNYANTDTSTGAQTAELENYTETIINGVVEVPSGEEEYLVEQARIAVVDAYGIWQYGARIQGTIMSESSGIENFAATDSHYFYYAGNAPSKPIIEFTLTPIIDDTSKYISNPKNSYTDENQPYNTIAFESLERKELHFTTPSLYTGYNQAIEIFKSANGQAWTEIRKQIRDYVNHPAVRTWANKVIDNLSGDVAEGDSISAAIDKMKYLLTSTTNDTLLSSRFIINNKMGQATAKVQYRIPGIGTPSDWATYGSVIEMEEDVGDMIRSNYLIIEDQNQPTEDGHIIAWEGNNEANRLHSHVISHDVVNGLKNVYIKYNNMYL